MLITITNCSFQLKPNQLGVMAVPFKISPIRQKTLKFEVEVITDGVYHKLNSSITLKVRLVT